MMAAPIRPYDSAGVVRDGRGVAGYADRPASLVTMLRGTVEQHPGRTADRKSVV